jgi:hypothetical protein
MLRIVSHALLVPERLKPPTYAIDHVAMRQGLNQQSVRELSVTPASYRRTCTLIPPVSKSSNEGASVLSVRHPLCSVSTSRLRRPRNSERREGTITFERVAFSRERLTAQQKPAGVETDQGRLPHQN